MHDVAGTLPMHAGSPGNPRRGVARPDELEARQGEPLAKLTARTLAPAALRAELEDVRERGVARERDEAVLGESSVAAPIFDHVGLPVGAIGVVGDTDRSLPRGPARGVVAAVTETARWVKPA